MLSIEVEATLKKKPPKMQSTNGKKMLNKKDEARLILLVEESTNTKYVNFYDIGGGKEMYVFYQEDPRTDLGHSNYLGVFIKPDRSVWFTNAKSVAEQSYPALKEDDEIIVTRYTHDFVQNSKGHFIDGGLDYVRTNANLTGHVVVRDGQEVYIPIHENS